jgi:putative NADH-flavin reductase
MQVALYGPTGKAGRRISMEDYAIALVNELERPEHRKQRLSVGY